jgi:carbon-monoxide dehydrogenase medium subunit
MIPAAFEYVRPSSVSEALSALGNGSNVKLLAGGQSLLPLLKLRLAEVGTLVDISRLSELRGIRLLPDGGFGIGSATTYTELLDSPVAQLALVADALPNIADRQTRYRGTIGGAIAHADPTSDMAPLLLALDATIVARSTQGRREIPITSFFEGPFETALQDDEILTAILLPGPKGDYGSAYRVIEQRASGYALVGVAAVLRWTGGAIKDVRVAITGVGDHPYRATEVETALNGSDGGEAAIAAAAAHATDGQDVGADIHADAEYRAAMAEVYVRRAVAAAVERVA